MSALAKVQLELFSVDNGLEITESKMIHKSMKVRSRDLKLGFPLSSHLKMVAQISFLQGGRRKIQLNLEKPS